MDSAAVNKYQLGLSTLPGLSSVYFGGYNKASTASVVKQKHDKSRSQLELESKSSVKTISDSVGLYDGGSV